jgi:hypothetical protein
MHPNDEKILRLTKEIVVKFIELGRVSPSNFEEQFKNIFWTLKNTVVNAQISGWDNGGVQQDKPSKILADEEED